MAIPSDTGAAGKRAGLKAIPAFSARAELAQTLLSLLHVRGRSLDRATPGDDVSGDFDVPSDGSAPASSSVPRDYDARRQKVLGVKLIKDKVYAVLSLISNTGSSSEELPPYENFILTNVSMADTERYQIVETFQLPIIYFMGEAPKIYDFAGILFNMKFEGDNDVWRNEFISYYESRLRGTQCVRKKMRASIDYDGIQVSGYVLGANISQDANDQNHVLFGFKLYVTSVRPVPYRGDP